MNVMKTYNRAEIDAELRHCNPETNKIGGIAHQLLAANDTLQDLANALRLESRQFRDENTKLREALAIPYAKAAALDKAVRQVSVMADSLACYLNPDKGQD